MLMGLPPPVMDWRRSLRVAPVMTALSGRVPVLKDRMARYCFLDASSPRMRMMAVEFGIPPRLVRLAGFKHPAVLCTNGRERTGDAGSVMACDVGLCKIAVEGEAAIRL